MDCNLVKITIDDTYPGYEYMSNNIYFSYTTAVSVGRDSSPRVNEIRS